MERRSILLLLFVSGRTAGKSQVMLMHLSNPELDWMYLPAWETLVEGFLAYPRSHALNVTEGRVATAESIRPAVAGLSRGDMLVWIGSPLFEEVPWRQLRARGVFTVYYRTEPHEACRYVLKHDVDETWEYTLKHVDTRRTDCSQKKHRSKASVSRYIPPGYLQRRTARIKPEFREGVPPKLTFFGNVQFGERAKCKAQIEADLQSWQSRDALHLVNNVWGQDALDAHMANNSLYLSIHKKCARAGEPFEAFRASLILRYGGLIISEQSYGPDQHAFQGIVTFVTLPKIGAMYRNLALTPARELARRSAAALAAYAARFQPNQLFRNAGVYRLLDDSAARSER
jgi:hypothetical protein